MNLFKSALKTLSYLSAFVFILSSCTDDGSTDGNGKLRVSADATLTSLSGKSAFSKTLNASTEITELRVNLKEFELELDDDSYEMELESESEGEGEMEYEVEWDDDGYLDYEDEIELEGPFELDLLSGQITFINVTVPNGRFEEVEFEFGKSTDPDSELFGKSILIKGSIDGTPFVFWHDFEDEIELDYDDPSLDITIDGGTEGIVINFDFGSLLNGANGIDLSLAADGNEDGLIEISPIDPDGNNQLAEALRDLIKDYMDLLDD